ncbi:GAF domain-containing sensor histidine kinase [Flavobacterium kingsejongi]|uniref:histidine kinase n=1 Tax=Flavobacterium kingsejongi TaxID=1678728 RepID=A0A2S1LRP4_9FLAO|nr:GAF domain-containing sensor histidine kinase [Flavobacterium kingsejongi]AWG26331.1 hypothetical protein FK004_14385 [Flavobacterium kingsejongi]
MITTKPQTIIPENDKSRLEKLYEYQILDTHPEDTFDKIALLASQIFDTPHAYITFVDEKRVFFKSMISNTPNKISQVLRENSLCSLAILNTKITVFNDTLLSPELQSNSMVKCPKGIRFYAGAPLKSPEGFLLGAVCVTDTVPREVTEKQLKMLKTLSTLVVDELEDRLRYKKVIKAQNDLMGITLHEIKNPLASIKLANDILKMDLKRVPKMADMIKKSVDSIQYKLTDLLKLSEMEDTEFKLSIQETSLKLMLDRMISSFELIANRKGQKIILDYDSSIPKINVDKNKITDVLHNLLSNAIKYSYPNTLIRVIAKLSGDCVEIEFQDEGQGLSNTDLDKLFVKFAKLSSSPTGKESSNGLGLSICKSLVELHKGKIYATSKGKEQGASFIISLPVIFQSELEYLNR